MHHGSQRFPGVGLAPTSAKQHEPSKQHWNQQPSSTRHRCHPRPTHPSPPWRIVFFNQHSFASSCLASLAVPESPLASVYLAATCARHPPPRSRSRSHSAHTLTLTSPWPLLAAKSPPSGLRNGFSRSATSPTTSSRRSWRILASLCATSSSGSTNT
jgi:hypothetical protein